MQLSTHTYGELRDENLIREAHRLHNSAFPRDAVDYQAFEKILFRDPNIDEELMLFSIDARGYVRAFLFASEIVREPKEAVDGFRDVMWVKGFAVDASLGKGLWREVFLDLMKGLERLARGRGKRAVVLYAYPPFYYMPGVNILYEDYLELFEELGYSKREEAVNYYVDLTQFSYPRRVARLEERLTSEGVAIRRCSVEEAESVSTWAGKTSGIPFWRVEVRLAFENTPPTVLVAEASGKLLGFSAYSPTRANQFGPIGVDPSERKRGVGTVLLFKALQELKLAGYTEAVIPWTEHLFFYTQVPGIHRVNHYIVMAKSIA